MKAKKWRKLIREARAKAVEDAADALPPGGFLAAFSIKHALYSRAARIRGRQL